MVGPAGRPACTRLAGTRRCLGRSCGCPGRLPRRGARRAAPSLHLQGGGAAAGEGGAFVFLTHLSRQLAVRKGGGGRGAQRGGCSPSRGGGPPIRLLRTYTPSPSRSLRAGRGGLEAGSLGSFKVTAFPVPYRDSSCPSNSILEGEPPQYPWVHLRAEWACAGGVPCGLGPPPLPWGPKLTKLSPFLHSLWDFLPQSP